MSLTPAPSERGHVTANYGKEKLGLIAEKNRLIASCPGPPSPGSPLSVGGPTADGVVLAAVSAKGGQCPATIMSSPPCSLATPGPLAPGEAGQGDGQGPPQTTTSTTSSPTEPQVPALRLPPTPGGGLGQAGTHEMSKISLPQATKAAERRPLSPHAGLPRARPRAAAQGGASHLPPGRPGERREAGKGGREEHSDRGGPPAYPPKKDKWKQAEESPNLASWPQPEGEERDLQDTNVPPRKARSDRWHVWRRPTRRRRAPRFARPSVVLPVAVPGRPDQGARDSSSVFPT